jgi:U3 small nucleolar RNA-associated protein 14
LPKTEARETASTLKSGTLAAPLPTVVLDRIAREAAYEQTSQEGAKWGAVMKRIKEADQLKFPLQLGGTASQGSSKDRQRGGVKSGGDLMGDFQVCL